MPQAKTVACYVRVSTKEQNDESQRIAIERWLTGQGIDPAKVVWYADKASGRTMERPGWTRLANDLAAGQLAVIVVFRLDRLGRTVVGLSKLFEELKSRKVNLVSLSDGIDLSTPTGRMMANMLASVAEYHLEISGENQRAGIDAAKARGVYKGAKAGFRKAKPEQARKLRDKGLTQQEIAGALNVSRQTVVRYLRQPAPAKA